MNYYMRYIRNILNNGLNTYARGLPATTVYNQIFTVKTGVTFRRNKDNPLIGFMEGLQFVARMGDVDQIKRIAPNAKLDLFSTSTLYGSRVVNQIERVINELNSDPDSRRANLVLTDQREHLENRPCTTSMQFHNSLDYLTTSVTMRSSDAVYGLPYDLVQFGIVSQVIGYCTKTTPATTSIFIGNAHIYRTTEELAKGYKTWSFKTPYVGDRFDDYVNWAEEEIKLLSMERLEKIFLFKEEK